MVIRIRRVYEPPVEQGTDHTVVQIRIHLCILDIYIYRERNRGKLLAIICNRIPRLRATSRAEQRPHRRAGMYSSTHSCVDLDLDVYI